MTEKKISRRERITKDIGAKREIVTQNIEIMMRDNPSSYSLARSILSKSDEYVLSKPKKAHKYACKALIHARNESVAVFKFNKGENILQIQNRSTEKRIVLLRSKYLESMAGGKIRKGSSIAKKLLFLAEKEKMPKTLIVSAVSTIDGLSLSLVNQTKSSITIDRITCSSPSGKVSTYSTIVLIINSGAQISVPLVWDGEKPSSLDVQVKFTINMKSRTYNKHINI